MSEAAATRVFFQKHTRIVATVAPSLCYCNDTGDWRARVLLATQGGRKTTASRIGKKDGRLWNLPFPEHMELAHFADEDDIALWGVPVGETDLGKCPRLQPYRKCLMPEARGITFDLTKGKDLICALPYREYGMDVDWCFVMCFRDESKRLHWFVTEETLRVCKGEKPTSSRGAARNANERPCTSARSNRRTSRRSTRAPSRDHAEARVVAKPITAGCVVYHADDITQTAGQVLEVAANGTALIASRGQQYLVPVRDLVLIHAPALGGFGGFGGFGFAVQQQPLVSLSTTAAAPARPAYTGGRPFYEEEPSWAAADSASDMAVCPTDALPPFVDATLPGQEDEGQAQAQPAPHCAGPAVRGGRPADGQIAALPGLEMAPAVAGHGDMDWASLMSGIDLETELAHATQLMEDNYLSSLGNLDVHYT